MAIQLDDAALAFLREPRFAVLATVDPKGTPQQTVMWYDVDDDAILMNTAAGRVKAQNLQQNPHASICVEDGYRYVTVAGTIQLIEDPAIAQRDIKRLVVRYHGAEHADEAVADFAKETRVTLRLSIDRVVSRV